MVNNSSSLSNAINTTITKNAPIQPSTVNNNALMQQSLHLIGNQVLPPHQQLTQPQQPAVSLSTKHLLQQSSSVASTIAQPFMPVLPVNPSAPQHNGVPFLNTTMSVPKLLQQPQHQQQTVQMANVGMHNMAMNKNHVMVSGGKPLLSNFPNQLLKNNHALSSGSDIMREPLTNATVAGPILPHSNNGIFSNHS